MTVTVMTVSIMRTVEVSIFNTLTFHCMAHRHLVLNHASFPKHVSLLCVPRLSLADLSSQKEEMTAESVLEV